jgi:membrane-associated phospholipid phosphatase
MRGLEPWTRKDELRADPTSRPAASRANPGAGGSAASRVVSLEGAARAAVRPRDTGYNTVDLVAMVYFAITGAIALLGIGRLPEAGTLAGLHAAILAVLVSLRWAPRSGAGGLVRFLREWYLVLPIPFLYMEVGHLNRVFHDGFFDRQILDLEAALFGGLPSIILREALPWRPLSEFLHFCYLSYYWIFPVLGVSLYLRHRFEAFRTCLTVVATTMLSCYLVFILYPVMGPYHALPFVPAPGAGGWFFPHLARSAVEAGRSLGTAFPSSHAAVAVVILLCTRRFLRPLFYPYLVITIGIGVGAVYGGFHYAVDILAGALSGFALWKAGLWIDRVLRPRLGLALDDSGDPGTAGS